METKKLFTTIQAGKYKGKKLLLPSLERTRSTKSVLKGSFFDTFQYEIIDQHFVEVFGGSGSMGLEALSRGAKHAYFIEYDQKAFSTLKENCKSIDSNATTCYQGDAFKVLPTLLPSFTCKTISVSSTTLSVPSKIFFRSDSIVSFESSSKRFLLRPTSKGCVINLSTFGKFLSRFMHPPVVVIYSRQRGIFCFEV